MEAENQFNKKRLNHTCSLKVLQIMHASPYDSSRPNLSDITGVDRLVANMMPYWPKHNIKIFLVYPEDGPNRKFFAKSNCHIINYAIGGKFDFLSIIKIIKIIKKTGVRLIHSNGQPIDLFGAIAAKLSGVPIIITRHSMIDDLLISNLRKNVYKQFDSLALRLSDCVIAICQTGANHLARTSPYLKGKIKRIYNGIQVDRFPLKEPSISCFPDYITIGFIGRVSEEKGVHDFLKVMWELLRLRYTVKGIIVGGGPDLEKAKKMSVEYGIEAAVEFCGIKNEVLPFLHKMDIFLLPSFREGFPLSILEAMAVGLPVISTRIGGIPEQLIENVNGFLVVPGDISKMVAFCIELIEKPWLRKNFGKRSRKIVEKMFKESRMASKYAKCFWELSNSIK